VIELTEKSRKLIKAFYRGVGAVAVSLSLNTCVVLPDNNLVMYGPGPDWPYEEIVINGMVISKKTGNPVTGIGIWIKDVTGGYVPVVNGDGEFSFYLRKEGNYTIVFSDINGEEDGLYKQHTINLTWEEANSYTEKLLVIELEEADAE